MRKFWLEPTKKVKGFENYLVTQDGIVFKEGAPKPLSQTKVNSGYLTVELWRDGSRRRIAVHVVVAEAWIREREQGECIRHLDGNKLNNNVSNLAVGSRKDNEMDKVLHGTSNQGSRHGMAKLTEVQVLEIRDRLLKGESSADVAREFSICERYARGIKNQACWKHLV